VLEVLFLVLDKLKDEARPLCLEVSWQKTKIQFTGRPTTDPTTLLYGQANLSRCTLVHKRRKIGPEFWPTQRAVIRLGIATHLVVYWAGREALLTHSFTLILSRSTLVTIRLVVYAAYVSHEQVIVRSQSATLSHHAIARTLYFTVWLLSRPVGWKHRYSRINVQSSVLSWKTSFAVRY